MDTNNAEKPISILDLKMRRTATIFAVIAFAPVYTIATMISSLVMIACGLIYVVFYALSDLVTKTAKSLFAAKRDLDSQIKKVEATQAINEFAKTMMRNRDSN